MAGFSPDGRSFATSQGICDRSSIWNAEDGTLIHEWNVGTMPSTLTFSPDGSRLLARLVGAQFHTAISPPFGTCRTEPRLPDWPATRATPNCKASRSVTTAAELQRSRSMAAHEFGTGSREPCLTCSAKRSRGLETELTSAPDDRDHEMNSAFSPDDRFLATASMDGPIRIWDVGRASLFTTITGHRALIEHLEFSPVDNNILLTASHDGTARLWDIDGILTTALPHEYPPTFAVFSPDNVHLLTGGGDAAVHLWDAVAGRELAELDTHEIVHNCDVQPRWKSHCNCISCGPSSHLGRCEQTRDRASSNLRAGLLQIQFSPEGDLLVGEFDCRHRTVVERSDWRRSRHYPDKWEPQVVFNPDGDLVLAATSDNAAHLSETGRDRTEDTGRA